MKTLKEVTEENAWLGQVINLIDIEDYQIVSYLEKDFDTKKITNTVAYGGYYQGKAFNEIYYSLEGALIGTIAKAKDGINTRADKYFIKMIS